MDRSPEILRAALIVEERYRERRRQSRIDRRDYWTEHRLKMRKRTPEEITKIAQALNPLYKLETNAMNLYNCKHADGGYRLTKFTKDYEVESSYVVSAEGCDCPAGIRPVCRHRTMLPFFLEHEHVDDGWFFIWDTRQWLRPIAAEVEKFDDDGDQLRPQGAPSTDHQPTNEFVELATQANDIAEEIEQADRLGREAAQPAPPTVSTPIAPQTTPASAEGAGFKFRRPVL